MAVADRGRDVGHGRALGEQREGEHTLTPCSAKLEQDIARLLSVRSHDPEHSLGAPDLFLQAIGGALAGRQLVRTHGSAADVALGQAERCCDQRYERSRQGLVLVAMADEDRWILPAQACDVSGDRVVDLVSRSLDVSSLAATQ